jgi:hypothetical protein
MLDSREEFGGPVTGFRGTAGSCGVLRGPAGYRGVSWGTGVPRGTAGILVYRGTAGSSGSPVLAGLDLAVSSSEKSGLWPYF